jgi:beta-carotene 3-hydroxylase
MANWIINTSVTIAAFIGMECMAWITHKYVMHGLGWFLHKDHHQKETTGFLERNDSFFLIFAIPGIACLITGMQFDYNYIFWIGLGITIYGFAYFLVHDVFIHQRIHIFRNASNRYLKGIRRAHKMHHKHLNKEDGECFGMLWVPLKYFRENKSSKH